MGHELTILASGTILWLVSFALFRRFRQPVPVPVPVAGRHGAAREISIIIPARNEEANLPLILESIAAQPQQPHEVIVVNDESTDDTAGIAGSMGARVIPAGPLPESWRGKTWACHRGASEASGRLLLFLDADCRLEAGGLEEILARYPGGAMAVCPYHEIARPHEEMSAIFHLVMVAGVAPDGLFGQCLLIERESYVRAGTHEAVKVEILENVKFAPRVRAAGIRTTSMPGRGMVCFRMYPNSLAELVNGWTKGFAAGAAATPPVSLMLIIAWIGGLITGMVAPFVSPWGWLVYAAFALQMAGMLARIGNYSPLCGLLYPLALGFYLIVFARSLGPAGRKATWKGRKLHAA